MKNELSSESSPYLLQHAQNPVFWKAWNQSALDQAKAENKLIIVSIGYAACHWCHVMEEESFENQEVADFMNENFISIKVDREERPDIDHVYMDAVQLMTGRGGWPLNAICLPDGRAIFGGTYFTKDQWLKALKQLHKLYVEEPEKAIAYAEQVQNGIQQTQLIETNTNPKDLNIAYIKPVMEEWKTHFDTVFGGIQSQTKFPIPSNLNLILRYGFQAQDQSMINQFLLTLDQMQAGGIFDQVSGGFARYSVDSKWHIPHFEKMLYDNAQLIETYSQAYQLTKNETYLSTISKTFEFLQKELRSEYGAYYSSLDADSNNNRGELEEGAYYVFTEDELKSSITEKYEWFAELYGIRDGLSYWENGNYHLILSQNLRDFAKNKGMSIEAFEKLNQKWITALKKLRENKPKPRLDDKILNSWNALIIQGFNEAFKASGEQKYLAASLEVAEFIEQEMRKEDGGLWRNFKNGKSSINAYLEDYAQLIKAYISLYEVSGDERWVREAKSLTDYTLAHFSDDKTAMLFYTSDLDNALVNRKIEIEDQVIPSSNASMAENLHKLSLIYGNTHYKNKSRSMLLNVLPRVATYAGSYSEWINLSLNSLGEYYEIAIAGDSAQKLKEDFFSDYTPNAITISTDKKSDIPLMQDRFSDGETAIYICIEGTCLLPQFQVEPAKKLIDTELH